MDGIDGLYIALLHCPSLWDSISSPFELRIGRWHALVHERWVERCGSLPGKSFTKLCIIHKFNVFPETTMTGNVPDRDHFVTFGSGVKKMAQNHSRPRLDLQHKRKIKPLLWGSEIVGSLVTAAQLAYPDWYTCLVLLCAILNNLGLNLFQPLLCKQFCTGFN